jgi:hypothetical protein
MNKAKMKKNEWSHVRLRPVARRFWGADGPQLPPVDDDWMITGVNDDGVRISNNHTGHGTLLAWDQIHHWSTDPDKGGRNGILTLNTQVNIGGTHLWCEPTFRPGEALPDAFANVRNWKRENDPLYIQRLYARPLPVPPPPAPQQRGSVSGGALFLCLCVGVGLLIANA